MNPLLDVEPPDGSWKRKPCHICKRNVRWYRRRYLDRFWELVYHWKCLFRTGGYKRKGRRKS